MVAGRVLGWLRTTSSYHWSRPGVIDTSWPVRLSTMQECTPGLLCRAWSAMSFNGTTWPPRHAPSQVSSTVAPRSLIRSDSESALKPANTTVCRAPSRAEASIATGSSGTIPM